MNAVNRELNLGPRFCARTRARAHILLARECGVSVRAREPDNAIRNGSPLGVSRVARLLFTLFAFFEARDVAMKLCLNKREIYSVSALPTPIMTEALPVPHQRRKCLFCRRIRIHDLNSKRWFVSTRG